MRRTLPMAVLLLAAVSCTAAGMRAVVCDPLEWLYPDSRIEDVRALESVDVPSNGVVEANIFFNWLDAKEPLSFSCDADGGEWFRFVAVPVEKNTGPNGFTENREKGVTNRYVTRGADVSRRVRGVPRCADPVVLVPVLACALA